MVAVQEIKTVGPSEAEKLSQAGVTTVEGLIEQGKTRSGRHRLAAASGLPEHDILKWVDRAHLMELKGVGKQYADLLEVAGVDSSLELSHRLPANLHQRLLDINTQQHLVQRAPHMNEVENWIQEAKATAGTVEH
ncbi:MAG: DUF4332 domain-containing protein [Chloroflexi bacterium]|nr:DUF4332 domain-containing protein [Chloroflexota bacterium]